MADIKNCVICEKRLDPLREQVDTCAGSCCRELLKRQRGLIDDAAPRVPGHYGY